MKAPSLRKKLIRVSGVFATAIILSVQIAVVTVFIGCPNTFAKADPSDDMGRWAPDERWTKWQEDVDRGYSAYKRKDFALAQKIYLKALDKAKKYGDNPSKVVEVLAKLVVSMVDGNQIQKAEPYYQQVLALAAGLNKKNALDELSAICMEDLSNTYEEASGTAKGGIPQEAKSIANAKFCLRHTIDIREKVFSKNHPKLIITHSLLANVCITAHDYDGARKELETIHDSMKGMKGKAWIHTSRFIIYLSCVYEKLGRKADAAKIIAEIKQHYGPHGTASEIERYKGNFYRMTGETDLAESWYRKELALEVKDGSKYGEMIATRNIGYCYEDRDNPKEAEKYFRRGLELAKKSIKIDTTHKFSELIDEVERSLRAQKKYKEADLFHSKEIEFLRVQNPLFKSPTRLYQEELEALKKINEVSESSREEIRRSNK